MSSTRGVRVDLTLDGSQEGLVPGKKLRGHVLLADSRLRRENPRNVTIALEMKGKETVGVWEYKLDALNTSGGTEIPSEPTTQSHLRKGENVFFEHSFSLISNLLWSGNTKQAIPFDVALPVNLAPSTRIFHVNDNRDTDWAEVNYELCATVSLDAVTIRSNPRSVPILSGRLAHTPRPIAIALKEFDIYTCLFWKKGKIDFCWKAESDVIGRDKEIWLEIDGTNHSHVEIKDFQVKWVQTITFRPSSDFPLQKVERVIASTNLQVPRWAVNWMSTLSRKAYLHSKATSPIWGKLKLSEPPNSNNIPEVHESFHDGMLIFISHEIVVTAQTAEDLTTNPKISHPVYFVKHSHSKESIFAPQGTMPLPRNSFPVVDVTFTNHRVPEHQQNGNAPSNITKVPLTNSPSNQKSFACKVQVEDASDSENEDFVPRHQYYGTQNGETWMEPIHPEY